MWQHGWNHADGEREGDVTRGDQIPGSEVTDGAAPGGAEGVTPRCRCPCPPMGSVQSLLLPPPSSPGSTLACRAAARGAIQQAEGGSDKPPAMPGN